MIQAPSLIVLSEGEGSTDSLLRLTFLRAVLGACPQARIKWWAMGPSKLGQNVRPLLPAIEISENLNFDDLIHHPPPLGVDYVVDMGLTADKRDIVGRWAGALGADFVTGPLCYSDDYLILAQRIVGDVGPLAPLGINDDLQNWVDGILPPGPRYVGLIPGAVKGDAAWPLGKFCELALGLSFRRAIPVFLLGAGDEALAQQIRNKVSNAVLPLLDVKVDPLTLVGLGRGLDAVVGNQQAGIHLLAAGGAKVISLCTADGAKLAPLGAQCLTPDKFWLRDISDIPVSGVGAAIWRKSAPLARS